MLRKALFDAECAQNARQHACSELPLLQAQALETNAYITLEYNDAVTSAFDSSNVMDRVTVCDEYTLSWSSRRLFLVHQAGCSVSFPPFASPIVDAHVERVDAHALRLIVLTADAVHVALLHEEGETLTVAASALHAIDFTPARLHRIRHDRYALIDTHGRTHTFACDAQMHLVFAQQSLRVLQAVCRALFDHTYVDSMCMSECGVLLVLTARHVTLWRYDEEAGAMVQAASASLQCLTDGGERAAAIVAASAYCATVICHSGACVPLHVTRREAADVVLDVGAVVRLPREAAVHSVFCACSAAGTVVVYDAVGRTLTLLVSDALVYDEAGFAPATLVSQVDLATAAISVVVQECDASSGDAMFAVYGASSLLLRVRRHGSGALLARKYDVDEYETTAALQRLPPYARAAMLVQGVMCGLASDRVGRVWDELCVPSLVDACTACASPAAQHVAHWLRQHVAAAAVLCDTAPHWQLAVRLLRKHDCLQRACKALSSLLRRGGWLGCATLPPLRWSRSLEYALSGCDGASGAPRAMSLRDAVNGQAVLWGEQLRVMREVAMVCWLYGLLIQHARAPSLLPSTVKLMEAVVSDAVGELAVDLCARLLASDEDDDEAKLTQLVHARSESLPKAAAVLTHVYLLLRKQREAAKALRCARTHLAVLRASKLLDMVTTLLERLAPELLPAVHLAVEQAAVDAERVPDVVALLTAIPASDVDQLRTTLTHILRDARTTPALAAAVVRWMADHPLDDPRLVTFADVVAQFDLDLVEHGLTSRFFACWKTRQHGQGAVAARRFGELARTEGAAPLSLRLRCITYATEAAAASEVDKMAHFTLLLQQQLSELIERGRVDPATRQSSVEDVSVESDLQRLRQHFLSERALFELAGRHRALGGASVQLDLLKTHSDAPESVIADVVMALLLFLHAGGMSAIDAVRCVLSDYVPSFVAPVPMRPFVDFLALEAVTVDETIAVLLSRGVVPTVVFHTLLSMLERQARLPFAPFDVLHALTGLVEEMEDDDSRRVCVEHLLDYLQAVAAGEYKVADRDERLDMFALKSLEGQLQSRLDQLSQWA